MRRDRVLGTLKNRHAFWARAPLSLFQHTALGVLSAFLLGTAPIQPALGCARHIAALAEREKEPPKGPSYQAQFKEQKEWVRQRISERIPGVRTIRIARRSIDGTVFGHDNEIHLALVRGLRATALEQTYATYIVFGDTADLYLEVEPALREQGISRLFVLEVLRKHPNLTHLPATLGMVNESSFLVFLARADAPHALAVKHAESPQYQRAINQAVRQQVAELKAGKNTIAFRRRLIQAAMQTPAGRVRASVGFSKLTRIDFRMELHGPPEIELAFEKGEPLPEERIEVRLVTGPVQETVLHKLLHSGEMQLATSP